MNVTVQTKAGFRGAQRLAEIGVSEILKITALANDLKRQGRDVIVLGAGEPDFDTPDHVKEAAARAMFAGATKYTALDGTPGLKAAIRNKFKRDNVLRAEGNERTVKVSLFVSMLSPHDARQVA